MSNQSSADYFPEVVGLDSVKRRLKFYLDNYKVSSILPNFCLSCMKGGGKTMMASLVAKLTGRNFIYRNCIDFKTLDDLFGLINTEVVGKNAILFFDEAESLSNEISLALLTILNPNKENRTEYIRNDAKYTFDFRNFSVIFASTELHQMHHALLDRLTIIDFDDYEPKHLEEIIKNNLNEFKIEDGLLARAARVVRQNPRQAQALSNDLIAFLKRKGNNSFESKDWAEFFNELGLYDLGLTSTEVKLLKVLEKYPNSSLTKVASIMNLTVDATRKHVEKYPLALNLMEIRPATGRILTMTGLSYLQEIKKHDTT